MSIGFLRQINSLFVVIILLLCLQISIVVTTTHHAVQAWIPPSTTNSFMSSRSSKRQTDYLGQQELIRINNYQYHSKNNLEKTITKSTIQLHFQRAAITIEQQKRTKAKTTTLAATTNNVTMQQKPGKKQLSKKPSFSQAVHTERIQQHQQQQQLNSDKKKTLIDMKQKTNEEQTSSLVSSTSKTTTTQAREYKINSDSFIGTLHKERLATAGRPGTKRFIDPCKVYIGNLPFTCTGEQLSDYVCNIVGLSSSAIIHQCKVIYDWKTLKSKGYGFVIMTEPIYATVLMTKCDTNETLGSIDNRRLTISQGKSKEMEKQLLIEEQEWIMRQDKKNKKKLSNEENVIDDAIYMDQSQIQMLKRLDPDLAIGIKVRPQELSNNITDQSILTVNDTSSMNIVVSTPSTQTDQDVQQIQMDDDDDDDDEYDVDDDDDDEYDTVDDDDDIDNEFLYDWEAIDNNEVYDDSDDGIDGIWDDNKYDNDDNIVQVNFDDDDFNKFDTNRTTTTDMNREQRRNATAAASKKRKLSNKGFG